MEGINILDALAVLLCACVSAMGLGGGGVLILYLTLLRDTPQMIAQGVNLLFFLPAPSPLRSSTKSAGCYVGGVFFRLCSAGFWASVRAACFCGIWTQSFSP